MSTVPSPPRGPIRRRRLLWALAAFVVLAGVFWFALDRMAEYFVAEMDRSVLDTPRSDDSAHKPSP